VKVRVEFETFRDEHPVDAITRVMERPRGFPQRVALPPDGVFEVWAPGASAPLAVLDTFNTADLHFEIRRRPTKGTP
jgi:hypothetical protein